MNISLDYKDLFRILNKHKVKYLVIGAYAVAFYTEPRFTKDLDIWVSNEKKNAHRIYKALINFGAPLSNVSEADFTNKKLIYQIGIAPIRIDILMGISGVKFESAWKNRKISRYGGISINILGIKELIRSKKATKREQDLLDVKKLSNKNFYPPNP